MKKVKIREYKNDEFLSTNYDWTTQLDYSIHLLGSLRPWDIRLNKHRHRYIRQ